MKTFATAAAFALLASGAAFAADALPPTYVVYKLTADGVQLRSLEAERGIYEARVLATDGSIVKVGIDPQTAELTDAFSHAKARTTREPAPRVSAAEAVQAAAATGFWDVAAIEYEKGAWDVTTRDDQGRVRRVSVDGATGLVR